MTANNIADNLWPKLVLWWTDSLGYLIGAVLAFAGFAHELEYISGTQTQGALDPIFGLTFRGMMLIFGIAELLIASLCLFTEKKTLSLSLGAWLSVNYLAYRIGLWSMGYHHSCGFELASIGLSLRNTDLLMSAMTSLVLIGSIALLIRGPLNRKIKLDSLPGAETLKMFCVLCNGHIEFSSNNLGQKIPCTHCKATITLMESKTVKASCPSCGEHLEFPIHAVRQKTACPHCEKMITLGISRLV